MSGSGSNVSRRVSEFLGVALFAAALIWIVSLASYEPADPVWFFSTGSHAVPVNFAGRVGAFFAELARVVRPGGRIALLEVAQPTNTVLRFGHGLYFGKVVPRIGALLSDASAYRYLPKSVAYLPEPPVIVAMLRAAGFSDANRTTLTAGISQLLVGTRS